MASQDSSLETMLSHASEAEWLSKHITLFLELYVTS
jgi:hypothetical protein